MADLEKVQTGDSFKMPANAYNAFVDAALAHRSRGAAIGRRKAESRFGFPVLIKNVTGQDLLRFNVVGLGEPVVLPGENWDEFVTRPVLTGEIPVEGHRGRFAILSESIPADEFGLAWVSGIAIAVLHVFGEDHQFAEVEPGSVQVLATGDEGTARILWKGPGTDLAFAVVRIDASTSAVAPRLVQVTFVPGNGAMAVQGYTSDDVGVLSRDGDEFAAYAWPGQANAHYELKMGIVMVAEKFGGAWFVHMTGDRAYTEWPTEICEPCVP